MPDYCDQSAAAADVYYQVALQNARTTQCNDIEYLYCADCGDEITRARREIVPGCRLCVACQELKEKQGG